MRRYVQFRYIFINKTPISIHTSICFYVDTVIDEARHRSINHCCINVFKIRLINNYLTSATLARPLLYMFA